MARRLQSTVLLAGFLLGGCAEVGTGLPHQGAVTAASWQRELAATVVMPDQLPADLIRTTLGPVQKAVDQASNRRGIEAFHLHDNPVAMRIASGADAAWVLSFLGTARQRTSLNVEVRALVAGGSTGVSLNYSGPTTLGRALAGPLTSPLPEVVPTTNARMAFELVQGLPGGTVTSQYGRYLERLGDHLRQRYDARPFQFDDVPHIFALQRNGEVGGFLFTNQGNHLILGERKYADVQSVAFFSPSGQRLGAYTLIGFNEKTEAPTGQPAYTVLEGTAYGALIEFGDGPGRPRATSGTAALR